MHISSSDATVTAAILQGFETFSWTDIQLDTRDEQKKKQALVVSNPI
jgi:hypothetical protein